MPFILTMCLFLSKVISFPLLSSTIEPSMICIVADGIISLIIFIELFFVIIKVQSFSFIKILVINEYVKFTVHVIYFVR